VRDASDYGIRSFRTPQSDSQLKVWITLIPTTVFQALSASLDLCFEF